MTETHETTHPWIDFQVDLSKAPISLWLQLGEAKSKIEHIEGIPIHPTKASDLQTLFLAKGVLATTAIEGNTLSEQEVIDHLQGKLQLPPSRQYLAQEIQNIAEACTDILSSLLTGGRLVLSVDEIKDFNWRVLDNLEVDDDVIPGEIRRHEVTVGRYRGAPGKDCEHLLIKLCEWLNSDWGDREPENRVTYSIIKAIIAHLYLAWIHPFGNGNGRTARLMEFKILLSAGVPSPAAHLLSNHYNQTRGEYYRQLDISSKGQRGELPFLQYAVQGFVDGLDAQIEIIREEQQNIAWRNYVHDEFKETSGLVAERRRRLVLDLALFDSPVPLKDLHLITPRIAQAYSGKTQRTVLRDINVLITMGLIERINGGYRAKKETILAFLPPRVAFSEDDS